MQARIQDSEGGGGFVQEFRLENRSYPDVHDFSLRMQVIIANANNIADSLGGGGRALPPPQKKKLYPRLGWVDELEGVWVDELEEGWVD